MQIKVLLFAQLKEMVGASDIELELPKGCTGKELVEKLVSHCPDIGSLRDSLMLSMDDDYITENDEILEGSEIAVLTPVSGG